MGTPWEIADGASRMLREAQQAREDVARLLAEVRRQRDELAGAALWCSMGEHAFSAHDRKRAVFTVQTFDDDTGAPVEERHVACGQCAAKRRAALQARPQLPAGPPDGADPDLYRRFLEWQAGAAEEPPRPPDPLDVLEARSTE